jgi:dipicolinate synthase subunit A
MRKDITTFGIVGGDKRQLFLAKSISDSCYEVILGGFDRLESTGALLLTDIKTAINESDVVIFPLPSVRVDRSINTPFSDKVTLLDSDDLKVLKKKPVFVAMRDKFLKAYPQLENSEIYDYSTNDSFAILNALPTAEGAVEVAMNRYEGTIAGSKCLITGFGRIGKVLAKMLKSLNADVTVSARKDSDFAYISALGYKAIDTRRLRLVKHYDIVFNTIPSLIFDESLLMNTDRNTLIIDLASLPGGVDFEAAHRFKVDAVRALSLPGKCAPKTAGEIIKTTIFNIIEEAYR